MMTHKISLWEKGSQKFNQGLFWQAHEDWELSWKNLIPPEKDHVQALIQGCAVFVHLQKNNLVAALALCNLSLEKSERVQVQMSDLTPRLEIEGLTSLLREISQTLTRGESPNLQGWLGQAQKLRARIREIR